MLRTVLSEAEDTQSFWRLLVRKEGLSSPSMKDNIYFISYKSMDLFGGRVVESQSSVGFSSLTSPSPSPSRLQ